MPCLTTRRAGAADDERGQRRDVDRRGPVAAGAAGVDHRARRASSGAACASIALTSPLTSVGRLALARAARRRTPAIWAGVAAPDMISVIAQAVSSALSDCPASSRDSRVGQL